MKKNKIGVIGCGFVGTAVSVGLEKVAEIWEHDAYKDTHSLPTVVNECDILFLCLPTPMNEDGSCNTSIIEEVIDDINRLAESTKTIVVKSTVPPGSTQRWADCYPLHTFIFNPEFLTEANFINDFLEQDRIILGITEGKTQQSIHRENEDRVRKLYLAFADTQEYPAVVYTTSSKEAEMCKYTANCFLATKVIFFNEIKSICEVAGIDYEKMISLVLLDCRIGVSHCEVPGPDGKHGFGGSCFTKDINALIAFADALGVDTLALQSVWSKNLLVREECEWENLAQVTGDYDKQ
ncbi:MAG: UDP-glucose/GDP-mannose dehydrogenase family protein [Asgard group archaeon]|nr:UDP-glucose/GDP-mannose dehydrogenase family protein [Asgard group archaeon]